MIDWMSFFGGVACALVAGFFVSAMIYLTRGAGR
jgi:hypothetical protein